MIPKKTIRLLIQLCVGIFLLCGLALCLFYFSSTSQKELSNRLFPNIYIDGKPVGKMNKTEVYLSFADDESKKILIQLISGTNTYLEKNGNDIGELVERITSKGGTTEAGLAFFRENKINKLLEEVITQAEKKSKEIGG